MNTVSYSIFKNILELIAESEEFKNNTSWLRQLRSYLATGCPVEFIKYFYQLLPGQALRSRFYRVLNEAFGREDDVTLWQYINDLLASVPSANGYRDSQALHFLKECRNKQIEVNTLKLSSPDLIFRDYCFIGSSPS